VRDILYGEEFVDLTPVQIYAKLLDRGVYHCSVRTMYRLLEKDGPCPARTRNRRRTHYEKPELLATRPNQLWSWDITRLKGPARCHWFQLYVILDVFSRYVVAWTVADREDQDIAAQLIDYALAIQKIAPGTLTIHADRGAAMTSKCVAVLLSDLGVTKTHSRPHVSNDNPYSEAQFKTLKYRPEFPARFGCIEEARSICGQLFEWYNGEHVHEGIALLTPATVHYGRAQEVIKKRQQILIEHYGRHPQRFVKGAPEHRALPAAVFINPPLWQKPAGESQAQAAADAPYQPNAGPSAEGQGEHLSRQAPDCAFHPHGTDVAQPCTLTSEHGPTIANGAAVAAGQSEPARASLEAVERR
jgi:putative transposase